MEYKAKWNIKQSRSEEKQQEGRETARGKEVSKILGDKVSRQANLRWVKNKFITLGEKV